MKDYANTMRSLCIVHSGASVSLIYARMAGGWGVYAGAVSIEAMTVPLRFIRPFPFVHTHMIRARVRAYVYFVNNNNNNK